jgi:hypothetical protein
MSDELRKINPRDITVANADDVHKVRELSLEKIREIESISDELDDLKPILKKLEVSAYGYKQRAREIRKEMNKLSTEL